MMKSPKESGPSAGTGGTFSPSACSPASPTGMYPPPDQVLAGRASGAVRKQWKLTLSSVGLTECEGSTLVSIYNLELEFPLRRVRD